MHEPSYPVNVTAPDLSPYRVGNAGVDYVTTIDSGQSGPHVMLSALVHGNELCGAHVLDFLMREAVRPTSGRLTLAFVNVAAFETFDPQAPGSSRFIDEDLNRLWDAATLDRERESVELRRARELRPILDSVDLLLDIHSMQHPATPLMLAGPTDKGRRLARRIATPAHVVCDDGHDAGPRMRDYAEFADESSSRNALLVECGQHWDPASIDVARDVSLRFLACSDIVDLGFVEQHLELSPPPVQRVIEVSRAVTVGTDGFHFAADYRGMEVIEHAGTVIAWDGDLEIRTPYDHCVLIMPSRRLTKGVTAVRLGRYVED